MEHSQLGGRRLWIQNPQETVDKAGVTEPDRLGSEISGAIARLNTWINDNGSAGWDPYDAKDTRAFRWMQRGGGRPRGALRGATELVFDLFPQASRRFQGIKPKTNAKAMGLFLASYSLLARSPGQDDAMKQAVNCSDWLLENRSKSYSGYAWGYPFDWQSVRFIPEGTPSSVVSSIVGDGFFALYRTTEDQKWLQICDRICHFFVTDLKITYRSDGVRCYSYTPIDDYQVHNANLFVAEFLTRIGKELGNRDYLDAGIEAGRFALSEQTSDGFLPYWSVTQTASHSGGRTWVDHYHSGFEIRSLYGLWRNTGASEFRHAAKRYLEWYLSEMFTDNGFPKYNPVRVYPINIHTCAESILCLSVLAPEIPNARERLSQVVYFTQRLMEYAPGMYRHQIRKVGGIYIASNIPMIRWGQAWMLRSLVSALTTLSSNEYAHDN